MSGSTLPPPLAAASSHDLAPSSSVAWLCAPPWHSAANVRATTVTFHPRNASSSREITKYSVMTSRSYLALSSSMTLRTRQNVRPGYALTKYACRYAAAFSMTPLSYSRHFHFTRSLSLSVALHAALVSKNLNNYTSGEYNERNNISYTITITLRNYCPYGRTQRSGNSNNTEGI